MTQDFSSDFSKLPVSLQNLEDHPVNRILDFLGIEWRGQRVFGLELSANLDGDIKLKIHRYAEIAKKRV